MKTRYHIDGKDYYSVTQILNMAPNKERLKRWWQTHPNPKAYTEIRQFIGHVVHWRIYAFWCHRMGIIPDSIEINGPPKRMWGYIMDPDIRLSIQVIWSYFLDWVREHKVTPIYLEKKVWDEDMEFAGTLDFYGIVDGKRTLIDWKTAKRVFDDHTYGAQLTAYEWAGVKRGFFKPVDQYLVVRLNEVTGKSSVPMVRDWGLFYECWTKFRKEVMHDVSPTTKHQGLRFDETGYGCTVH